MSKSTRHALIIAFVLLFLFLVWKSLAVFTNEFKDLTDLPGKVWRSIVNAFWSLWDSMVRVLTFALSPSLWVFFYLEWKGGASIGQAWESVRMATTPASSGGADFSYRGGS